MRICLIHIFLISANDFFRVKQDILMFSREGKNTTFETIYLGYLIASLRWKYFGEA